MELECTVPGEELFLRQLVDTAGLMDREAAAAHGSNYRSFAAHDPSFGIRGWQILHEQHPAP